MDLTLANCRLASLHPRMLLNGHLRIAGGRIDWIGTELPPDSENLVDCQGRLVMPGNVCGHTHLYSALARGMPAPKKTPRNFVEILEYIWWRLDRALDERSTRASVVAGALDAVRAGTTTLIDHHSSQEFIDGSLDVVAEALGEIGVRGVICFEVTDRNGPEGTSAGLRETERFLTLNRRELVKGLVGAHASFTLSDDTLAALAGLCDRFATGTHIHVAEDQADEDDALGRGGERVGFRLRDATILRERSIAAHCVRVDRDEAAAICNSGSWIVHNCRSNMNNSVGRAPLDLLGERVALGTDGIDQDMFAESRTAYLRRRDEDIDAFADQFTDMLSRGGEMASQYFPAPVGRLEVGANADLVVYDYDAPTPLTESNLPWHWMFAMTPAQVRSVMIGGRWVLKDGEMTGVDEERLRAEAAVEAKRLWERMDAL